MYYYIADHTVHQGRGTRLEERLKARLQDLGILGQWVRAERLEDVAPLALEASRGGYTTIVAVGSDETADEMINGLAKETAAVGIIPTDRDSLLAARLGIASPLAACDILAARKLTAYSLIAAGQRFFLSSLTLGFGEPAPSPSPAGNRLRDRLKLSALGFGRVARKPSQHCRIRVDDTYTIEADIVELQALNRKLDHPQAENRLSVLIETASTPPAQQPLISGALRPRVPPSAPPLSHLFADRLVLDVNGSVPVTLDGRPAGKTPVVIRLTDRRIRLITQKVYTPFAPT